LFGRKPGKQAGDVGVFNRGNDIDIVRQAGFTVGHGGN